MNAKHLLAIALLCAALPIAADDEFSPPVPGVSLRTNSSECLARYEGMYNTIAAYVSVPSSSTLTRLDVLTGGILNTSPFQALTAGKHQTKYYATTSTYGNAAGTVRGVQAIEASAQLPLEIRGEFHFDLSTVKLRVTGNWDSCDAGEKFDTYMGLYFFSSSGGVRCSTSQKFPDICADTATNLITLISAATVNVPSSGINYNCYDSEGSAADSIGHRTEVVNKLISKSLVDFCAAFE